jgi:HK97 family phage major capsid protein
MDNPSNEIKQQLDRIADEVRAPIERLKHNDSETQARLLEVEQKLARRGGADGGMGDMGGMGSSSLTKSILADEGFLMLASGKIRGTRITLPAGSFHGVKASPLTSAGGIGGVSRLPNIFGPPERRTTIRSLLPVIATSSGSVEFVREAGSSGGATTVAEATLKPETILDLSLETAKVVTIATWLVCSKQVLADVYQMQNYIDGRLRMQVALAEDAQLLGGDGTGANLMGLLPSATAYTSPFVYANATKLDVLRLAAAQLQAVDYVPSGVVLHPLDAAAISLLKSSEGTYLAEASSIDVPSLWGLPVCISRAMPAGTFLIGDFQAACMLFDRESVIVEVGFANDDFLKNLVRIRAEERLSLAVMQPSALVTGTFV